MDTEKKCCENCRYSMWTEESSFDHYRIASMLICKKQSTLYADKIVREWETCEEFEPRKD